MGIYLVLYFHAKLCLRPFKKRNSVNFQMCHFTICIICVTIKLYSASGQHANTKSNIYNKCELQFEAVLKTKF